MWTEPRGSVVHLFKRIMNYCATGHLDSLSVAACLKGLWCRSSTRLTINELAKTLEISANQMDCGKWPVKDYLILLLQCKVLYFISINSQPIFSQICINSDPSIVNCK